jgi:hypothetical protein
VPVLYPRRFIGCSALLVSARTIPQGQIQFTRPGQDLKRFLEKAALFFRWDSVVALESEGRWQTASGTPQDRLWATFGGWVGCLDGSGWVVDQVGGLKKAVDGA